jgi:hypothetical protein
MKIQLADGRSIDMMAFTVLDNFTRAVALFEVLDNESLVWLRSRLSEVGQGPCTTLGNLGDLEQAFTNAINRELESRHKNNT